MTQIQEKTLLTLSRQAKSRCFALPEHHRPVSQPWFDRWLAVYGSRPIRLPQQQQQALAQLIPVLLCGEQSAVILFHREVQRLSTEANSDSVHLFNAIEQDEALHDRALETLQAKLPPATGLQRLQRRSRLFFMRLGRSSSMAAHFGRIAHLDSAVAIIMKSLEQSLAARERQIAILLRQIKQDEARHVFISRNHAFQLGLSRPEYSALAREIRSGLGRLLQPSAADFECLGVDPDKLFRRLQRSRV